MRSAATHHQRRDAVATDAPPTDSRRRAIGGFALRAAIGLALAGFILWRYGRGSIARALHDEDPRYFWSAVLLFVAGQAMSAYRWQIVARLVGLGGRFKEYFSFYFVGMFTNLFVPGLIGGDAARAFYLARKNRDVPHGSARAAASVMADRLLGLAALFWVAAISAVILGREILTREVVVPVLIVAAVSVAGYLTLPLIAQGVDLLPSRIAEFARVMVPSMERPVRLIPALTLSIVLQVSLVFCQYLIALGLGLQIPLLVFFLCVPLSNFFASIPITLNGLGLREGSYLFLFKMAGVGSSEAVTLSLLYFAATMVGGLTGVVGLLMARASERRG
jgi:uncharacterized membrane protein YbhN (UPF0104 family)